MIKNPKYNLLPRVVLGKKKIGRISCEYSRGNNDAEGLYREEKGEFENAN